MSNTVTYGAWTIPDLSDAEWKLCAQHLSEFWNNVRTAIMARYPDAKVYETMIWGAVNVEVAWPNDGGIGEPRYEASYYMHYFAEERSDAASNFVTRAIHHIEGIRAYRLSNGGRIQYVPGVRYGYA